SRGSTTQVYALLRQSQPVSSAMIECDGWRARMACTMARSAARSAAVTTLLRSDFCSVATGPPKCSRSTCPPARAHAIASSIIAVQRSAAAEARRPLLDEVRDAFLEVLAGQALEHQAIALGERLRHRLQRQRCDLLLDHAQRARRARLRQLERIAARERHQLV